jgi:hypothetical protein
LRFGNALHQQLHRVRTRPYRGQMPLQIKRRGLSAKNQLWQVQVLTSSFFHSAQLPRGYEPSSL